MPIIKIIGDSIAAGVGCSVRHQTEELVVEDEGTRWFRTVAPNSWWGLLDRYLKDSTVRNNGCSGAYTYQIARHLDELISLDDQIVFVLMGLNDRKRPNGGTELRENTGFVLGRLRDMGKTAILCTPTPSAQSSEYLPNRFFHTEEVVAILREVAHEKQVKLVDHYCYICDYLAEHHRTIEDIIYGEGCSNDGLHPSDLMQRLMFEHIVTELGW